MVQQVLYYGWYIVAAIFLSKFFAHYCFYIDNFNPVYQLLPELKIRMILSDI